MTNENDGKELETLQREYRNMEINRKAFADESNLVLRRQQQSLEKLRNENESLKTDIATIQTKTALQPVASFERKSINRIHSEMDRYSTKIEIEKNRISRMEDEIESMRTTIWQQRRSIGGVNAARENQLTIEKQVRILENRLEQALVKYNKSVATNKSIRQEIDDLRGERLAFENVHKKLEKELVEKKKQMSQAIEISNIAYEQRDKSHAEVAAIKILDKKEKEAFEEQMIEIGRILEEDVRAIAMKQAADHARILTAEIEKNKKPTKPEKVCRDKEMLKFSRERVQNFEEAFRKISSATGINDVDDLVEAFIANEEHNFSLYSYANEQANEIERLEDQLKMMEKEQDDTQRENGSSDQCYEETLTDLNGKIEVTEKQHESLNEKCVDLSNSLSEIKQTIIRVMSNIGCNSDEIDFSQTTEANMMFFLGLIEQRTNDILSTYHRVNSKTRLDETIDASFVSTFSNVLGPGPLVPMDKDPLLINPPKVSEYSSDEDSFDEQEAVRPLSLEDLKRRKIPKELQRRNNGDQRRRAVRRNSITAF